jgi:hypothetical protein
MPYHVLPTHFQTLCTLELWKGKKRKDVRQGDQVKDDEKKKRAPFVASSVWMYKHG